MSSGEHPPFEKLAEAVTAWERFLMAQDDGSVESEDAFLARHEDLRTLLVPMMSEAPPAPTIADGEPSEDGLPDFGPYQIIEQIGSGGMGTVFLAQQTEPVSRRVALKVIKFGMDSRQVLARFNLERQALALMNHDNIARVFDAGTTPRGQPFFVMEHVAGLPINQHCDKLRLSTSERLKLFRLVCYGVHHAHQKGVIHRDIKPSNILVSVDQGVAVPKIIDFGLARATGSGLGPSLLVTGHGQLIGTPQYMSPEQADTSSQDIDTRTDIYSLGITLYELIVGKPPWSEEDVTATGGAMRWRRIFETDLRKPSTKLLSGSDETKRFADLRRSTTKILVRELRGDLDWITMKALDRDRNRRYGSAAEFAADIDRFLANEPVLASPPSASYRIAKFVRRNRWKVAAAALLAVTLIAGVVGTSLGLVEARAHAADARDRLVEADEARGRERDAREAAERWLDRYNLLAIGPDLTATTAAAAKLLPPTPETEPRIREWLEQRAKPLIARAIDIEAALAKLRAEAPKLTKAQVKQDRDSHPANRLLADLRGRIDMFEGHLQVLSEGDPYDELAIVTERLASLNARHARVERIRNARRTWTLPSHNSQFLHDALSGLRTRLKTFESRELARVRELHEFVLGIEKRSISDHAELWRKTAFDIGLTKVYRGLSLKPQIGLVPLGKDPKSGLFEFVHLRSGSKERAIPKRDSKTGALRIDRHTGIVFVLLPRGEARIGAQRDPDQRNHDPQATPRESPISDVRLDPYFIGKHEITQAQWLQLTGKEPSGYRAGYYLMNAFRMRWTHPVENILWHQAETTMRQEGLTLPTEVQWEYACRAGTSTPFSCGKDLKSLQGYANIADRTAHEHVLWSYEPALRDGHLLHAPIGSFLPNAFGIHDMHGNLFEWCLDPMSHYVAVPRDGDGLRAKPGVGHRLTRGGCYNSMSQVVRSAARNSFPTDHKSFIVGVRAVRKLDEE